LLKEGKLKSVVGVIHTPLPATPCRTDGEITEGLVHSDVANDPARLETVIKRPNILRDFLANGGHLISMYSRPDLHAAQVRACANNQSGVKVTPESMNVFEALKAQYPKNLTDRPTQISSFKDEHSGATYIATDPEGNKFGFSIRAYQAHTPGDGKAWGLWAGDLQQRLLVRNRVQEMGTFCASHGTNEILVAAGLDHEIVSTQPLAGTPMSLSRETSPLLPRLLSEPLSRGQRARQ
jgi:hypothetical protein